MAKMFPILIVVIAAVVGFMFFKRRQEAKTPIQEQLEKPGGSKNPFALGGLSSFTGGLFSGAPKLNGGFVSKVVNKVKETTSGEAQKTPVESQTTFKKGSGLGSLLL